MSRERMLQLLGRYWFKFRSRDSLMQLVWGYLDQTIFIQLYPENFLLISLYDKNNEGYIHLNQVRPK